MMRIDRKDIEELTQSGRFDPEWYVQAYPDVAMIGMSPAEHYLWIGARLGRPPRRPDENASEINSVAISPSLEVVSSISAAAKALPSPPDQPLSVVEPGSFDGRSYLLANPDVAKANGNARDHWTAHGKNEWRPGSGVSQFADRKPGVGRALRTRLRVCFMGPISIKSGLGTAARGYVDALSLLDIDLEVIDTSAALYPNRLGYIEHPSSKPDITIIHQNADAIGNLFKFLDKSILDDTYVVGIWVYELLAFREKWREAFAAVDEVWTPSAFCAESIATVAPSGFPIKIVPHVVPIKELNETYDRKYFGVPNESFVFLCSFDASSSIERKNPASCLKAFREAFAGNPSAFLVLKYHSAAGYGDEVRALRREFEASNVLFMDIMLTHEQSDALKGIADCAISPHRSEGFGLNIAEMMALGKPVIVTGYSGNMQFCNCENSLLIPYSLTEVTPDAGPYPRGALWADPHHDELVSAMRRVASSTELAANIGAAAKKTVAQVLSTEAVAHAISDNLSFITSNWKSLNETLYCGWNERKKIAWRHPCALSNFRFEGTNYPVISVIVPVYNIDAHLLHLCVESVISQSYPLWELCIYDDGSTKAETVEYLESIRGSDQRIKVRRAHENRGISFACNAAAEMATGDYLAFLDNDDTIAPTALEAYATAIVNNPDCAMLYCDEDKLDSNGNNVEHYFKPDWSPEHLESCMYVLHMLTVKKQLFFELGGYREEYVGAQDYDFALRVSRNGGQVVHIPQILYHWRMIEGSAAAKVDAKPTALINARRALEDYAWHRYGSDAEVDDGIYPGLFRIRRGAIVDRPITLVILTNNITREVYGRGEINLVENFLRSIIDKTSYRNYNILVSSDGELTASCRALLQSSAGREVIYRRPGKAFNFAHKANFSIANAETELVVLLNDDMEVRNDDWLNALVDQLVKEEVGVVGAHLSYPDHRIQHVGMVIGINGTTGHVYHGHPDTGATYNSYASIIRNYSAVTGACMATKKSIYNEVGGFDIDFRTDYNDTDYCLKVRDRGYRVVFTPFSKLYHFENQSFQRKVQNHEERELFLSRWKSVVEDDPYYNRNLRKDSLAFEPLGSSWHA